MSQEQCRFDLAIHHLGHRCLRGLYFQALLIHKHHLDTESRLKAVLQGYSQTCETFFCCTCGPDLQSFTQEIKQKNQSKYRILAKWLVQKRVCAESHLSVDDWHVVPIRSQRVCEQRERMCVERTCPDLDLHLDVLHIVRHAKPPRSHHRTCAMTDRLSMK